MAQSLDAVTAKVLKEMQTIVRQDPSYTPSVPCGSAERLIHYLQNGVVNSGHFGVQFMVVDQQEYQQNKEMVEKSKRENFWYEDKFWGWSFRYERPGLEPGTREAVLTNKPEMLNVLNTLSFYTREPLGTYAPALHRALHGTLENTLENERPEHLRKAYDHPAAKSFVAEAYDMKDAWTFYTRICEAKDAFMHFEATFGRDQTLKYLKQQYAQAEVSKILNEALEPEEYFTRMEQLYPELRLNDTADGYGQSSGTAATTSPLYMHK